MSAGHSGRSIHMIGAPGGGAPDLQFPDGPTAGMCVGPAEHLRRRCWEAGIMADSTGALAGREVRKCPDGADGDV